MTRRLLPLVLFFLLMGFLALSLYESESELPSPLIGKPIPEFSLENLITQEIHSNIEIIGEVSLINVWATWCVGCEIEHLISYFFEPSIEQHQQYYWCKP